MTLKRHSSVGPSKCILTRTLHLKPLTLSRKSTPLWLVFQTRTSDASTTKWAASRLSSNRNNGAVEVTITMDTPSVCTEACRETSFQPMIFLIISSSELICHGTADQLNDSLSSGSSATNSRGDTSNTRKKI